MARSTDRGSYSEADLTVEHPKDHAAGPTAVAVSMKRALSQMGAEADRADAAQAEPGRGLRLHELRLARPGGRTPARRRVLRERRQGGRRGGDHGPRDPGVLRHAQHRRAGRAQSEHWLGQQGRITQPMIKRPGATHYEPIDWDEAFALIGTELNEPGQPGRGDLLHLGPGVQRGRLRLPAVRPGVRHQQPARLLEHVPRVDEHRAAGVDRHRQGQRQHRGRLQREADHPGRAESRHQPSADAVRAGDRQAERRQDRLDQPAAGGRPGQLQEPAGAARAWSGTGTELADLHLPIKINGDLALFQALGSLLVQWDALDHDFIDRYTTGFEHWRGARQRRSTGTWSPRPPGCPGRRSPRLAQMLRDSDATVFCWAMGLTQHRNAVATIKEVTQPGLRPGQHRQARRRAVPGARALQRAGRPDDGDLGAPTGRISWTRCRTSSASTRRASTGWTPSIRSAPCGTARRTSSSASAATSSRPLRTPTSSSRRCAGPG